MPQPSTRLKLKTTRGRHGGGVKQSAGHGKAPPPPPPYGPRKSQSSGPSGPKLLSDISETEFHALRVVSPYGAARACARENSLFFTDFQERVFHEILMKDDKIVVPQKWIEMNHVRKNLNYFGEALDICTNIGLLPIMEFRCNYDPMLIAQFYATVHFAKNDTWTLTWMTEGVVKQATLAEFGAILGYEDRGKDTPVGFRCHANDHPMKKDVLAPLYIRGRGIPGKIKGLLPTYDILHRIFREIVAPRAGNVDEIHAFMVDIIITTFHHSDSGQQMDVMDVIWNEMVCATYTRMLPP